MNPLSKKILLILFTGAALGVSYTPQRYWQTVRIAGKIWKDIDKKELQNEIRNLYRSKLIKRTENKDGSVRMLITDKGRIKTLTFKFDEMKIENKKWDGKWRILVFDIPEKLRIGRDALRDKIKKLGFYELQKSVFVFPYECKNEIEFLIEFFEIRKFVRYGILTEIDNAKHLKKIFKLL